jgi:hypothetical protein
MFPASTMTLLENPLNRLLLLLVLATIVAPAQVPQATTLPAQLPVEDLDTHHQDLGSGDELPCTRGRKLTDEARFEKYLIRTYRWPDSQGCLQILRSGTVLYSLESTDFKIGRNFADGKQIPVGADITGAGIPNAIVSEWSGGAHCCFTLHVFELGDAFKEIAQIEAGDSDTANFVDLNHDGSYAFEGYDFAFSYWRASFASSPAPRIVLKYRKGQYRLAFDLMKTPNPSLEDFKATVQSVQSDDDWSSQVARGCEQSCGVPVALWKNMLDLMYGGHSDMAWSLLDESWPKGQQGKAVFAMQFCNQLKSSLYWPDLEELIGSCPSTATP